MAYCVKRNRRPAMGTFSPTHWFIVLVMITPLMALLVVPT